MVDDNGDGNFLVCAQKLDPQTYIVLMLLPPLLKGHKSGEVHCLKRGAPSVALPLEFKMNHLQVARIISHEGGVL